MEQEKAAAVEAAAMAAAAEVEVEAAAAAAAAAVAAAAAASRVPHRGTGLCTRRLPAAAVTGAVITSRAGISIVPTPRGAICNDQGMRSGIRSDVDTTSRACAGVEGV